MATDNTSTIENLKAEIKSKQFLSAKVDTDFATGKLICPDCKKPSETYDTIKFYTHMYCHHCKKSFDNLDIIAREMNLPVNDKRVIIKACELLKIPHNLTPDTESKTESKAVPTKDDKAALKAALLGDNATTFFADKFSAFIESNQKFSSRKTGFSNLDDFLNFQPGIYILGGLPALGKTTFALQLLNQLAKQGETCIYCSFEMQSGYLYSKLLAHEVNLIEAGGINPESQNFNKPVEKPLTASRIMQGDFSGHERAVAKALKNFEEKPSNLYVWELQDVNLNRLLNRIKQICDMSAKPPIICLDYLQLLAAGFENTKIALDGVLRQLFNFRRDTDTTFIVISSLNRTNYQTEISFESLKETGNIEYSADVIFGLQFKLDERNRAEIEKAKKQIPREIELKCLKNRWGANFEVGFNYFPNAEIFLPMLEYNEIKKSSRADETSDERDS